MSDPAARRDLRPAELTALLTLARRPQIGCSRDDLIAAGIPAGSMAYVLGAGTKADGGANGGGLIARGYVRVTPPELPTSCRVWFKITPRGLKELERTLAEAEAGVTVRHVAAELVGGNRMADFLAAVTPPTLPERPDPGHVLAGEVLPELVPADNRA